MRKTSVGHRRILQLAKEDGRASPNHFTSITPAEATFCAEVNPLSTNEFEDNSVNFEDESCGDDMDHSSCASEIDIINCAELTLEKLKDWALSYSVNNTQFSGLLRILKSHSCFDNWPSDSRTVLKPKQSLIIPTYQINPGQYAHIGLKNYISANNLGDKDLSLQINVDGLPLFKSNSSQFWPVLGHFSNLHYQPFVIGIYCGDKKPESANDYLKYFLEEFNEISKFQKINIECVVCDVPARAFLRSVKGHNGYHGCDKCTVEGNYINHRMSYAEFDCPLRSDTSFRTKTDEDHHLGDSCLLQIPAFDMVKRFPLDYMHLVCLGIVKKLLILWIRGKPKQQKLSNFQISSISSNLSALKSQTTCEFSRKPRALSEVDRWKATEFRHFLLYSGIVVIRNVVSAENFKLFVSLCIGVRILCSPLHHMKHNEYAKQLLIYFAKTFGSLYGEDQISYNVHALIHLADDVKNLGPLDRFSAFKFENALGKLKKLIRSPNKPLEQVIHRLQERQISLTEIPCASGTFLKEHNNPPLCLNFNNCEEFRKFYIFIGPNFTINCLHSKDSYLMTKKCELLEVKNIVRELKTNQCFFEGFISELRQSYFTSPTQSSNFNIYQFASSTNRTIKSLAFCDILLKCQLYNISSEPGQIAVIPIVHSEL